MKVINTMNQTAFHVQRAFISEKIFNNMRLLRVFLYGLILPLSFAPFHIPGAAIISLALFYAHLLHNNKTSAFLAGLVFGLSYFGFGTSWIYISIHEYGHLNIFFSTLITLIFLLYLAFFPASMAAFFKTFQKYAHKPLYSCLLFSSLWVLFEYARSMLFSGFPWLLLGFGQFDAPIKYLLPIVGVFGVSFFTCFTATLLITTIQFNGIKRCLLFGLLVFLIVIPSALKSIAWGKEKNEPLSVGIIQANLSMRDKWDEHLFWQLLTHYKSETEKLLGTSLIVMPESTIPLPPSYVEDTLFSWDRQGKESGTGILLGIPKPSIMDGNSYHNALISLGTAKGFYLKQHLVPFGEYIPKTIQRISEWLAIPDANLIPGKTNQALVKVKGHRIATLICYELAYGDLLRHQLPQAEWIVSISDDGWFGHSLAIYQQLQMAQVRSLQTGRYQVVANNDGLSSLMNTHGEIVSSLPAFQSGVLRTTLFPATGTTPWVSLGDAPVLIFCLCFVVLYTVYRRFSTKQMR